MYHLEDMAADKLKKSLSSFNLPSFFFFAYFILGSLIFQDFGVSLDEPIQRVHGIVSLEYANRLLNRPLNIPQIRDDDIVSYEHRDYGTIFQMFCYVLELSLNINTSKEIFLLRHFMVFFIFWISTICFYKLLLYRFDNVIIALLGVFFLILSPRIFANSFYNPKDLPLLSICIICSYTFVKFVDIKNIKYAILHSLACALAVNTRIVGIYLPIWTICFIILEWISTNKKSVYIRSHFYTFLIYTILFILLTIAFWPFLWEDPINHFLYAFKSMSHYRWYNGIFFFGKLEYPDTIPWYYIPFWIAITTPVLYLIFFILGLVALAKSLFRKNGLSFRSSAERVDLIMFVLLFSPILAIIILKSTVYNGWRHMYFVYPFIIYFSTYGFTGCYKKFTTNKVRRRYKFLFGFLVTIYLGYMVVLVIKVHPLQNVYFNELMMTTRANDYFDVDYYGISFKQGIEYLLESNGTDIIKVSYSSYRGLNNEYLLNRDQRNRIKSGKADSANYFITNYHKNTQSFNQIINDEFPYDQELIYEISVQGNTVLGVYRINNQAVNH